MIETISDFRATGAFTTIGGPAFVCLCAANFFGKVKINWYWLVPFIQAYILVSAYIALFGIRLTLPFHQTLTFIACGSIIFSAALCKLIQVKANYKRLRRAAPWTHNDFLLKIVGVFVLTLFLSSFIVYGSYQNNDCLSNIRCAMYASVWGLNGYSGSLLVPALVSGVGATLLFFLLFATLPMEES